MSQRGQQEGPEPALSPSHLREVILLKKFRKEALRQILRVFRTVSFSPYISVKWKPIDPAELLQRLGAAWGTMIAGGKDDAPMRGGEPLGLFCPRAVHRINSQ